MIQKMNQIQYRPGQETIDDLNSTLPQLTDFNHNALPTPKFATHDATNLSKFECTLSKTGEHPKQEIAQSKTTRTVA